MSIRSIKECFLLFFVFVFALHSSASETEVKPLTIWFPKVFTQSITQNKYGDYLANLMDRLEQPNYQLLISNDWNEVKPLLASGKIDIIFRNLDCQSQASQNYGYKTITYTKQYFYLFSKSNKNINTLKDIKSVGVIRGLRQSQFELNHPEINIHKYENYFELYKNLIDDNVEAIAGTITLIGALSETHKQSVKTIYELEERSYNLIMISKTLENSELGNRIKADFLSNSEENTNFWSQYGQSLFYKPDDASIPHRSGCTIQ